MITETQLKKANALISNRDQIKHILRGFDSPHIETTIGLVAINGAAKHDVQGSDDAEFMHRRLPQIEKQLKQHAKGLLEAELGDITASLSEILSVQRE